MDDLRGPNAIFVDEIMAVHSTIMDGLSESFRELRQGLGEKDSDQPFEGLSVVLCGDPLQLGRVKLYEGSLMYPTSSFPTYPFWRSEVWSLMGPTVMYLRP